MTEPSQRIMITTRDCTLTVLNSDPGYGSDGTAQIRATMNDNAETFYDFDVSGALAQAIVAGVYTGPIYIDVYSEYGGDPYLVIGHEKP